MQNFLIMAVLHGEANLREPVQKLILSKVILPALSIDCLKALLDLALEVAIVSIIHHDAQLSLLCLVDFAETHDVGVVEYLQNFGLVQSLPPLLFAHLRNVDLLDDAEGVVRLALDFVGRAKRAHTKGANFLVLFKLLCWFFCGSRLRCFCFYHIFYVLLFTK